MTLAELQPPFVVAVPVLRPDALSIHALAQIDALRAAPNYDLELVGPAGRGATLRGGLAWLRIQRPALVHTVEDKTALTWGFAALHLHIPHVWSVDGSAPLRGDRQRLRTASFVLLHEARDRRRLAHSRRLPPSLDLSDPLNDFETAYQQLLPPSPVLRIG